MMIDMRKATLAGALILSSCLPGDTRPIPATVLLTAEPSPEVLSGVTTTDGWQITFEQLFVGIGYVSLEGDACNTYANAGYGRLLDLGVPGKQKVAEVFGLGTCNLGLYLSVPYGAKLGQGVSEEESTFVTTIENDAGVTICNGQPGGDRDAGYVPSGASVYVRGQASRGADQKRFEWAFPLNYMLGLCDPSGDAGGDHTLTLRTGESPPFAIMVRAEELFRASPDDDAPLRFDALADADTDGDQAITLKELSNVALPMSSPSADAGVLPPCDGSEPTLRYLLEQLLLPRMVRLNTTGRCWGFISATLID
ncbi:Hypothetical protein A7982_07285 [Minicystis rosea]|nr:Hypothetical protein A7982_07285 [Minicystis rosea]